MATADTKGWIHFTGKKPDGSDGQEFKLPSAIVLHLSSKGPYKKFLEVFSMERDEFNDGFCYCGIPAEKYVTEDAKVPPPPGMVFLIFVNKEFAIFEFRWEKMCKTNSNYPENYDTRFKHKTWSP